MPMRVREVIRLLEKHGWVEMRSKGSHPGLTPEQQQLIETMTKSLINKIAHGPISELRRNAGQPEGNQAIELIRKVFHLQQ